MVRRWAIWLLLSSVAWAGQPGEITEVLPEATYSVGAYGPFVYNVPPAYNVGYLRMSRAPWTNALSRISWTIDISYDSGATWTPLVAGSAPGGAAIDPSTGLPYVYSEIGAPLPQPENPNRRMRGSFTVSGASVTTEVTARMEAR
jgi:hypothetical protein